MRLLPIRTYSEVGDLVLDNCIGSETIAIAAINTQRRWIGMERDETYFATAEKRIAGHQRDDGITV